MAVFLARRWLSVPHGEVEPNWDHEAFQITVGRANLILGGHPVYGKSRDNTPVFPSAAAGTIDVGCVPSGVSCQRTPLFDWGYSAALTNSRIVFGAPIFARFTGLIANGSVIRTSDGTSTTYYGYRQFSNGFLGTGGGGAGSSGRRDWSWTGRQIANCVKPNSTMSSAPVVYVDGQPASVSSSGGTDTTYNWGNATTQWQIGYDNGSSTYQPTDRLAFFAAFEGDLPDNIMAALSANPLQLVRKRTARLYTFPTVSAGGVTGTVNVTEANDTLSASGTVTVTGTVNVTEAADTLSASGAVTVSGTLAVTEADDTSAASGTVSSGITGSLAVTEEEDSLSAAGAITVTGTVNVTEADDTSNASGTVTVTGTVNVTEADDTLSASGVVSSGIDGTLAVTEAADTLSASGTITVTGSLAVTEEADTLSASGLLGAFGSLAVTEAADTLSAAGTVTVSGSLAATEADDTLSAAGTVTVTGAIAANEADDTLSASGTVSHNAITGTVDVTEAADTLAATGTLTISGSLSVVEENDTLAANDAVLVENPFIVKVTVNESRIISVTVQGNPGWAGDVITAAGGSSVVVAA